MQAIQSSRGSSAWKCAQGELSFYAPGVRVPVRLFTARTWEMQRPTRRQAVLLVEVPCEGDLSNLAPQAPAAAAQGARCSLPTRIIALRPATIEGHVPMATPIDDSVHMAARNNEADTVRAALDADAAVANARDKIKRTPLHLAAWAGHLPIVELLLEKGADPNAEALDNMVPLAFSAQNGHVTVCSALLAAKADPNRANSKTGKTPLMTATSKGKLAVVKLLIEGGADTKQRNHGGKTAAGFVNASAAAEVMTELTKLLAHDAETAEGDQAASGGIGAKAGEETRKKKKKNRQKKVTKRDRVPLPENPGGGGVEDTGRGAGAESAAAAAAAAAGPGEGSIGPRMPPPKRAKPSVALSFADELE